MRCELLALEALPSSPVLPQAYKGWGSPNKFTKTHRPRRRGNQKDGVVSWSRVHVAIFESQRARYDLR